MKKILTVQDFSCVGKCSLTVALPIISAFGIETCALPTAVLSNHTMFKGWTFDNLASSISAISKQWKENGFKFDGFYSGYLGSKEIISDVKNIVKDFCSDGVVLVDPAMGDNGKLYAGFDLEYAKANADLCALADILTPNITEACFILGEQYREVYDVDYLTSLCDKLISLGSKNVVITGVKKGSEVGVFAKINGKIFEYFTSREVQDFHGTGDIFSSALYGAVMCGRSIEDACRFACDYTKHCIAVTLAEPNHVDYGVNFEECTSDITDFVKKA